MKTNKTPSFSIADIEKMAINSSFERGEDILLYNEVQNIVKTGNRYDSVVHGSRPYKVYVIDEANDLHFNCTCPYDYAGICKHLVAFSLKILKGEYEETAQHRTSTLSGNDFKSSYSKISSKKKLAFLKQLLDRDNDLKQQFFAFTEDDTEKLDTIVGEKLEDVKKEIHSQLSNLDFDNLRYDYGDYGYRDSWDVEYEAALEVIKKELDPYISKSTTYIKKGNLLDAIRIALGLYEGSQNLPDLDNENYVFDGEYNNEVRVMVNEYIRDISNLINTIIKSDKAIEEVLTLIFDKISVCSNQNTATKKVITYNIEDFELLFQSLIINENVANFLHKKLQENKLESLASAYILLNIANVTGNEKLGIQTAETYAGSDAKIARTLLEKYHSKKQISNFNRIAELAFTNWADDFDKYLVDHLDKEEQEELFVKALQNYVSNKQNIKHYRFLKTYLSKEETLAFVDKFKDTYHRVFYVQLLEIEKRYQEILNCVKKNRGSNELEKLIASILNVYPNECFDIIVEVNNKAMSGYKRDRSTYQEMVKTLKLLKQITAKNQEVATFLEGLYNHKPNLPALKDEMRKAKLII